ncbi:unnamed protein product [Hymenolepis diminuta]|uniref:L51_S25_CI-B8 domain-containing protein n=1 Tax=Hymenolepis diminuta TaxID=6216 RepID=A0A0R3SZM2_HYMDI|nr:unnamed protein product [Hymenolepis diminuta]
MQIVISSGTVRFHVIFLKSLILHHFERGGPNAAPIHLHLLTDKASGYILEGILGSWRINKLRYTFYSAEPYYSFSYNSGVVMWNLQRLTMKKWEALYKPAYERALKVFTRLTAAEQTLMTVVIMENPEILYRLSCHWNFQLYEGVIPEECPSTWNRPPAPDLLDPLILHGDRYDKRELDFSLNEPKTLANHGRPNKAVTY